jgi:hypothetical protein
MCRDIAVLVLMLRLHGQEGRRFWFSTKNLTDRPSIKHIIAVLRVRVRVMVRVRARARVRGSRTDRNMGGGAFTRHEK